MPKTRWTELIWGGLIFVLLAGLILYAVGNRPLVDYNLNCPREISFYSNVLPLKNSVDLMLRNRGATDAHMEFIVSSENVSINPEVYEGYITNVNHTIHYNYLMSLNKEYHFDKIILNTSNDPPSFSVTVTHSKILDGSISSIFSSIFGEVRGYYHSTCLYNQSTVGSKVYYLVN